MTTSLLDAPPDLHGSQTPRFQSVPAYEATTGAEAIELAALAGLNLDPWQQLVLTEALGERADGKWAAFEVGVVVPRQNGKGGILEARELAGLFLLGERFIVHSAHQFDTSLEAFMRLLHLIEGTPELEKNVKKVSRSHGEEGIELTTGQRIRFRTRTSNGGRGFTGDCLILDEAMSLPVTAHGALLPTLSARPNPQVWYLGSSVDQMVQEHGVVLSRIRERGLKGDDPALAYFEWSTDLNPDAVDPILASDPTSWAQANPALGIRISPEHVSHEYLSMDARTFAVERLGAGDWPSTLAGGAKLIDPKVWKALEDVESGISGPVFFAFDVTPDRSAASICAAGRNHDGKMHVEVIENRRGTRWLADRLAELCERNRTRTVHCDGYGPAGSMISEIEQRHLTVNSMSAKEMAQACGQFFDLIVDSGDLRHLGTDELTTAIAQAATRPLGDAWAWSRKSTTADISPLVAATIAAWAVQTTRSNVPRIFSLADV